MAKANDAVLPGRSRIILCTEHAIFGLVVFKVEQPTLFEVLFV
jgi:hypothetical protein